MEVTPTPYATPLGLDDCCDPLPRLLDLLDLHQKR